MKCMTLTVLCCLAIGRMPGRLTSRPMRQNQRSWLGGRLLSDMIQTNEKMPRTFATREYARAKAITNRSASPKFKINDDDVVLLADYYYHTRARADEDLRQFQRQLAGLVQLQGQLPNQQPAGTTDEEVKAAQADRDEISTLGGKLADKADAVKALSELIYASLPGFCLHEKQTLPASYFAPDQRNGTLSYVGPVYNTVYAGPYAAPIDSYVNADAGRQAYWLRHVFWWHNSQNPVARLPGAGTGTGNIRGRIGANTTQSGTGSGNIRGRSGVNTTQNVAGTGSGTTRRNGTNQ